MLMRGVDLGENGISSYPEAQPKPWSWPTGPIRTSQEASSARRRTEPRSKKKKKKKKKKKRKGTRGDEEKKKKKKGTEKDGITIDFKGGKNTRTIQQNQMCIFRTNMEPT